MYHPGVIFGDIYKVTHTNEIRVCRLVITIHGDN